jgi:hypothetical protein
VLLQESLLNQLISEAKKKIVTNATLKFDQEHCIPDLSNYLQNVTFPSFFLALFIS